MDYDYDVIIAGAGPAGISAAIRVRWVKTYLTVPCSVLVLDTSEIGGLSNWKGVKVTGPSWTYSDKQLSEIFRKDVENLSIDLKKEEVLDVDLGTDVKGVKTSKNEYKCLSFIISTGFKKHRNEKDFIGRGLNFIARGYGYVLEKYRKFFEENEGEKILIIGSEKTDNLREVFNELNKNRNELIYVTEPETTVLRYFGGERLEGIEVLENGIERRIKCDEAILDFNSYELKPTSTSFLNKYNLLDDRGFIKTEKNQKTSIPGVFAAGDVTGYPSNFGKAIGQGIVAGFEAYRYVFKKKFNEEPNLFAFYPKDIMIGVNYSEIPKITKLDFKPKILTNFDDPVLRKFEINEVAKSFDGKHTLKEILSIHEIGEEKLLNAINSLIGEKKLTVHI